MAAMHMMRRAHRGGDPAASRTGGGRRHSHMRSHDPALHSRPRPDRRRRQRRAGAAQCPRDVQELMGYLKPAEPGRRVRAIPGEGLDIPIWILGSSLFGAQLAALLGLPYAFASHFAPDQMMDAIHVYRENFQPSEQLE